MNSVEDFVKRHLGKKVDFDGAYGAQCVDLFRQWCADNGIPHTGAVEGAKDLWYRYRRNREKDYFTMHTVSHVLAGDAVIWDRTERNPYGHVAIAIGRNEGDSVQVIEQDGFRQDGARLALRSLRNALGVLRIKKTKGV